MSGESAMERIIRDTIYPGAVCVFSGMRGAGKTHTSIAYSEMLVKHKWRSLPKTFLITNVIFVKKTRSGINMETPPGVYHVTTLRDYFPLVSDILEREGRKNVLIILLLDEAQNFLLGDNNFKGDMARTMKSFCGLLRKFNTCLFLLSPTTRNLGPAFRNFIDSDTDPGNVTSIWRKDPRAARIYMRDHGMNADPKSLIYVQRGAAAKPVLFRVPVTPWTVDWDSDPSLLKTGHYAYDHLSSADFKVGEFPFDELIYSISDVPSMELTKSIRRFYEALDAQSPSDKGDLQERIFREYQIEVALRLREIKGVTMDNISYALQVPKRTLYDRIREYGRTHDDAESSKRADVRDQTSARGIYISSNEGGVRHSGGNPPHCGISDEPPAAAPGAE